MEKRGNASRDLSFSFNFRGTLPRSDDSIETRSRIVKERRNQAYRNKEFFDRVESRRLTNPNQQVSGLIKLLRRSKI